MIRRFLLVCLLLIAVPCFALGPESMMMRAPAASGTPAPTYVNSNQSYTSNGPMTLTGVTAGHLLVAVLSGTTGGTPALSGGCSSTWTAINEIVVILQTHVQAWYCDNATGGSTSVTITPFTGDNGWSLLEYTNGTLDVENVIANSAANPATNSVTTTASDLLVGYLSDEKYTPSLTQTWTNRILQSTHYFGLWDTSLTLRPIGNYTFSGTRAGSATCVIGIAAFKGR